MKNEYQHNDDGTTYIFIESKNKNAPGVHAAIVDTKHWDKVKGYRWCIVKNNKHRYPYVVTTIPHPDGGWQRRADGSRRKRRTSLYLHRAILGKPKEGKEIDHINHNGLDNREENLRSVTRSQNVWNSRSQENSSSRYKGVSWKKQENRWRSTIFYNGKQINIDQFICEEQAARAHDKKALELYGEYACINFPREDYLLDDGSYERYVKKEQPTTSQYRGVSQYKQGEKWAVSMSHNGKTAYIGIFTCEEQAARAYDRKALELHGECDYLNFPKEDYLMDNGDLIAPILGMGVEYRKKLTSQYRGVGWDKQAKKWQVRISHNGKTANIGRFTCEKEAARAYNKKALELWGDEHFLLNEVE